MEFASEILLFALVLPVPFLRKAIFPAVAAAATPPAAASAGRSARMDVLKGIAIAAVVLIHAVWPLDGEPSGDGVRGAITFIANNAFRFAIPLFLVASGSLLSVSGSLRDGAVSFYRRRLAAIFVPYLIVSAAITLSRGEGVRDLILDALTGQGLGPYYFIPVIFQCYLLYPLIAKYAERRAVLWGSLAFSLLASLFPIGWNIGPVPSAGPFIFFFVYGVRYAEHVVRGIPSRAAVQGSLVIVGAYFLLMAAELGYYYNSRLIYGLAILTIFLAAYPRIERLPFLRDLLARAGRMSLWIFLVHFPLTVVLYERFIGEGGMFPGRLFLVAASSLVGSYALGFAAERIYAAAAKFAGLLAGRAGGRPEAGKA